MNNRIEDILVKFGEYLDASLEKERPLLVLKMVTELIIARTDNNDMNPAFLAEQKAKYCMFHKDIKYSPEKWIENADGVRMRQTIRLRDHLRDFVKMKKNEVDANGFKFNGMKYANLDLCLNQQFDFVFCLYNSLIKMDEFRESCDKIAVSRLNEDNLLADQQIIEITASDKYISLADLFSTETNVKKAEDRKRKADKSAMVYANQKKLLSIPVSEIIVDSPADSTAEGTQHTYFV